MHQQQVKEQYKKILGDYIPIDSVGTIVEWIFEFNFDLKITKERSSKLGDYTSPHSGGRHKISINHNLNPYAFLVTLTHEIAHLKTYNKHKWKVAPHGEEWKAEFRTLMAVFLRIQLFPEDVHKALIRYLGNPAASSCSDENLYKVLKRYDEKTEESINIVYIEQLPVHSRFLFNKREFIKGQKLRKRFQCIDAASKRMYLFSPTAEVELIK